MMDNIEQIKRESIHEFASSWTQEKFAHIAEYGFWESEEILINKYGSRLD